MAKTKEDKPPGPLACPQDTGSAFSKLTLWWLNGLVKHGMKTDFELENLPDAPKEAKAAYLENRNNLIMEEKTEVFKKNGKMKPPSIRPLVRLMFQVSGKMALIGVLGFFGMLTSFVTGSMRVIQNVLVYVILNSPSSASHSSSQFTEILLAATGIALCSVMEAIVIHIWVFNLRYAGIKVRATLYMLMYQKLLKWKMSDTKEYNVGHIINCFASNLNCFDERIRFLPAIVCAPVELVINLVVMWLLAGWYAVPGVAFLILYLGLHAIIGKQLAKLRQKTAKLSGERSQLVGDILLGIKMVKMSAWEFQVGNLVDKIRKQELAANRKCTVIRALTMAIFNVTGRLSFFLILLPYFLLGNDLKIGLVFTMTTFCYVLRAVVGYLFPTGSAVAADMLVGLRNIMKFLTHATPQSLAADMNIPKDVRDDNSKSIEEQVGIQLKNMQFSWGNNMEDTDASGIYLTARPGDLVVVSGEVGSGKTSFLLSLMSEIHSSTGSVNVTGSISYAPQQPWILAGSVQDNVVMGSQYSQDRYDDVVYSCCLTDDIKSFANGDSTFVGQNGMYLSGGQKARVNLARAVYANKDIIILDDPLSAVDTKVSAHLFDKCIRGYLKDKLVILVTHQQQHLKNASRIVLVKNGKCVASGDYDTLIASGYQEMMKNHDHNNDENENPSEEEPAKEVAEIETFIIEEKITKDISVVDPAKNADIPMDYKASGFVSGKLHWDYFTKDAGIFLFFLLLVLTILFQGLGAGVDYWLKIWVTNEDFCHQLHHGDEGGFLTREGTPVCASYMHFYVYIGLLFGSLFSVFLALLVAGHICHLSSKGLHRRLLSSVLRAKASYFDNQPVGNFQNRFNVDINEIDASLPLAIFDILVMCGGIFGPLVVVCVENNWLIIPSVLMMIFYVQLGVMHVRISGNFKRLEGVARSPLFSLITSSVNGLPVVRCLQREPAVLQQFRAHLDQLTSAAFHTMAANCWITSKVVLFNSLNVVAVVYIITVMLDSSTSRESFGLIMMSTFMLMPILWWNIIRIGEAEDQMTAVERVNFYSNLEEEAELQTLPSISVPEQWPMNGHITMDNVQLRYSENGRCVLKDLTLDIKDGERIGIIGRTGAGKSSLISAIFRLNEPEGTIKINDVAIGEIGLHALRKVISIIPQDPTMFTGTVRKNLDPFEEHSDESLFEVLRSVRMHDAVVQMEGGLNADVGERGSSFSQGQKQLLCIARSLLQKNRIIVLDEATANIDSRTDNFIQEIMRENFRGCTTLTVAHRLGTVIDCDRIMVMKGGELVEFGEPHALLQIEDSHLSEAVNASDPNTRQHLRQMAKEAHDSRL